MSKVPVISFVSSKGGAGKTTAALLLAGEIENQGGQVTLIDADPNRPICDWAALNRKPDLIRVVQDESEETILENIAAAKANSRIVLIDLEGTANMRATYAISQSDLVIIPIQGSTLDAKEAIKTIKLIKRAEQGFNRKIDFALLFSRMPGAITSKNFKDINGQVRDGNLPLIPAMMIEREAFKTIFSTGCTLHQLTTSQVGGLEEARKNALSLAEAVVERLNANRRKSTGTEQSTPAEIEQSTVAA